MHGVTDAAGIPMSGRINYALFLSLFAPPALPSSRRATPYLPLGVRSRDAIRFRVTHMCSGERRVRKGEEEITLPRLARVRGRGRDRSLGSFLFSDLATQEGSSCRTRFTRVDARETGRRRYRRVDSLSIIIERAGLSFIFRVNSNTGEIKRRRAGVCFAGLKRVSCVRRRSI